MGRLATVARRAAARIIPQLADRVACSVCGHERSAEVRLIAGPHVYLCSDCFMRAASQITPRRPAPDALRCRFCRQFRAPTDVAQLETLDVCADCLGQMDEILTKSAQ